MILVFFLIIAIYLKLTSKIIWLISYYGIIFVSTLYNSGNIMAFLKENIYSFALCLVFAVYGDIPVVPMQICALAWVVQVKAMGSRYFNFLCYVIHCFLLFVYCWVFYAAFSKGFAAFRACAAASTVPLPTPVARIGVTVINAHLGAFSHQVGFGQMGIGRLNADTDICPGLHGGIHGCNKVGPTVGVYGVIPAMIGYQHTCQPPAFGHPAGYGEHYPVAERHYRALHVFLVIAAIRYRVGTAYQRRGEILFEEGQIHYGMFYAQVFAMPFGTGYLLLCMVAPIVEGHGQRYVFTLLIEQSG